MGPAFAIVFIAILGLVMLVLAYCIIGLFCARLVAFFASVAFVVGAGVGAVAFLVVFRIAVGVGSFGQPWQVVTFLGSLAFSAVLAGGLLAFSVVRVLHRSNYSFQRTRYARR
jgi:hypothetical protein